jgi:hypothetical protein
MKLSKRHSKSVRPFLCGLSKTCASVIFLCVGCPCVHGAGGEDVLAQFRTQAPKAWHEHREISKTIPGIWKNRVHLRARPGSPARTQVVQEETWLSRDAGLVIHRSRDSNRESDTVLAWGWNPRYTFAVKNEGTAAAERWSLTTLSLNSQETAWGKVRQMITPANLLLTMIGHSVQDDFLFDPETRLSLKSDSGDLVTLSFFRDRTPDKENPKWPRLAEVTLDRAHFWVVTACRCVDASGVVTEMRLETRLEDGFPILVKRETRGFASDAATEPVVDGVEDFTLHYPPPAVPTDRFKLSSFGLPEPPDARTPFPWFLVAAIAGVLCIGLGFWILRARSRWSV